MKRNFFKLSIIVIILLLTIVVRDALDKELIYSLYITSLITYWFATIKVKRFRMVKVKNPSYIKRINENLTFISRKYNMITGVISIIMLIFVYNKMAVEAVSVILVSLCVYSIIYFLINTKQLMKLEDDLNNL